MSFCLYLDPADTMIFGDGRPFNQDDAGRATAASLFPPPPVALYGAARVAVARGLGWTGVGNWTDSANFQIGDRQQLAKRCEVILGNWAKQGRFKIAGPFFEIYDVGSPEPITLLPIPAHVYARVERRTGCVKCIVLLKPEKESFQTDLGAVRMLDPPPFDEALTDEPLAGRWAPQAVVERLLATGTPPQPDDLSGPKDDPWRSADSSRLPGWGLDDLAATESRVGIARARDTRLVEEGMLYASARRRLRPAVRMFIEIDPDIDGLSLPSAIPLGGESRFAFVKRRTRGTVARDDNNNPVRPPKPTGGRTYLVYFATPVAINPPNSGTAFKGLPGQLVTAAFSLVQAPAGLENPSVNAISASRAALPAGSVFFMQSDGADVPDEGEIGDAAHLGYGRYVKGVWNDG
jgi:CRISPR-associated protein (Cas_Cmr3)